MMSSVLCWRQLCLLAFAKKRDCGKGETIAELDISEALLSAWKQDDFAVCSDLEENIIDDSATTSGQWIFWPKNPKNKKPPGPVEHCRWQHWVHDVHVLTHAAHKHMHAPACTHKVQFKNHFKKCCLLVKEKKMMCTHMPACMHFQFNDRSKNADLRTLNFLKQPQNWICMTNKPLNKHALFSACLFCSLEASCMWLWWILLKWGAMTFSKIAKTLSWHPGHSNDDWCDMFCCCSKVLLLIFICCLRVWLAVAHATEQTNSCWQLGSRRHTVLSKTSVLWHCAKWHQQIICVKCVACSASKKKVDNNDNDEKKSQLSSTNKWLFCGSCCCTAKSCIWENEHNLKHQRMQWWCKQKTVNWFIACKRTNQSFSSQNVIQTHCQFVNKNKPDQWSCHLTNTPNWT